MSEKKSHSMTELPACPICGMFGGKRMIRPGKEDRYFITCENCGIRTKDYADIRYATRAWSSGTRKKEATE